MPGNVGLMWADGTSRAGLQDDRRFPPRHNGAAIRNVCRRFVELCRGLKLLSSDMVAIDGSRTADRTSPTGFDMKTVRLC
ncbi:transposase (fragment) [Paraburkholderia piptadeniae]|uniref:Transposase n=1 Tax=Paraburkholderia piptadeniae TaxID=1701573 RepID=A0A1N7SS72_9BURK